MGSASPSTPTGCPRAHRSRGAGCRPREARRAWQYNPGQKHLRRAPNVGYDNPCTASDGLRTNDQLDVVNGKADAFIYDAPYNVVAVNKVGNGKLVFLDKPFTYEPLAFGLKKGDYDSINFINNFLHQIHEDGTYDRIHDKWFKETAWLKDME